MRLWRCCNLFGKEYGKKDKNTKTGVEAFENIIRNFMEKDGHLYVLRFRQVAPIGIQQFSFKAILS